MALKNHIKLLKVTSLVHVNAVSRPRWSSQLWLSQFPTPIFFHFKYLLDPVRIYVETSTLVLNRSHLSIKVCIHYVHTDPSSSFSGEVLYSKAERGGVEGRKGRKGKNDLTQFWYQHFLQLNGLLLTELKHKIQNHLFFKKKSQKSQVFRLAHILSVWVLIRV